MIFTRNFRWSKNCFWLIVSNPRRACSSTLNTEVNASNKHIVWMDLEMTGLDVNTSHILELACLITDNNLKVISNDFNVVIHQPDEILQNMNEWCINKHKETGLTDESRASLITIQDAEKMVLEHLKSFVEKGICPLAGSTVYMDRIFLQKYMPAVDNYLHHRLIDTTTINELIKRWYLNVPQLSKKNDHRALSDIKESIRQLEHYKKHLFNV